ncbi:hypothetical protein F4801DRAFT_573513 [Xylaria longipes]|nr:hypothetical protein F4801DRAFT_573513 [Xylaria longipes]
MPPRRHLDVWWNPRSSCRGGLGRLRVREGARFHRGIRNKSIRTLHMSFDQILGLGGRVRVEMISAAAIELTPFKSLTIRELSSDRRCKSFSLESVTLASDEAVVPPQLVPSRNVDALFSPFGTGSNRISIIEVSSLTLAQESGTEDREKLLISTSNGPFCENEDSLLVPNDIVEESPKDIECGSKSGELNAMCPSPADFRFGGRGLHWSSGSVRAW